MPRRRRQREHQKLKTISRGLISRTKTLWLDHTLLFISLPSLHDYDKKSLKCLILRFLENEEKRLRKLRAGWEFGVKKVCKSRSPKWRVSARVQVKWRCRSNPLP